MDDFSYSTIRSFNEYVNNSDNLSIGTGEQLILNAKPGHMKLDRDTISVMFYDQTYTDFTGRGVGTTTGRRSDLWCQVDCLTPPNNEGEPREGACRKLKDKFETTWKATVRFPVKSYGTAGTQVERYGYIRQESASPEDAEEMEGWSRWRLDYHIHAIDTDA